MGCHRPCFVLAGGLAWCYMCARLQGDTPRLHDVSRRSCPVTVLRCMDFANRRAEPVSRCRHYVDPRPILSLLRFSLFCPFCVLCVFCAFCGCKKVAHL